MNWDALGAMAELLSALGVIATLLYLGRQIRVSAKAQRTATQHEILAAFRSNTDALIANDGLGQAFRQFTRRERIDDEYRQQLTYHISNVFRIYEEAYLAYLSGSVTQELWESRCRTLRDFYLTRETTQRWWRSVSEDNYFSQPFADLVEELRGEVSKVNEQSGGG